MHAELNNAIETAGQILLGKTRVIKLALACLLARGHLLIEDLPGVGKTTLAHTLAHLLGLQYQRIQFTSDLLPSDILGVSIFQQAEQRSGMGTKEGQVGFGLLGLHLLTNSDQHRRQPAEAIQPLIQCLGEAGLDALHKGHPIGGGGQVVEVDGPLHDVPQGTGGVLQSTHGVEDLEVVLQV